MKPHFSDLTPEQQSTFGNGCGGTARFLNVPDFIFEADCDHHDFTYSRGGNLFDKLKGDLDMCERMFWDALHYKGSIFLLVFYVFITYLYYLGLTLLPFSYFLFTWGRWRTIEEIIQNDIESKV